MCAVKPCNLWLVSLPLLFILPFVNTAELFMAGALITLTMFLAGHHIHRRQLRINEVTAAYFDLIEKGKFTNSLDALLKSGASELKNRFEIGSVCKKIYARKIGGFKPDLDQSLLPMKKFIPFFKYCLKNDLDIASGSDSLVAIESFNGYL